MAATNSELLNLLVQKMAYLNRKQALHAQNIANANTPGYKARELAPFTFNDALKQAGVGMAVTDPRHIVPASMAGTNAASSKVRSYEVSPDKNAVDVEQEALKVSTTGIEYQMVTSIFHKVAGFFKIALKGSA